MKKGFLLQKFTSLNEGRNMYLSGNSDLTQASPEMQHQMAKKFSDGSAELGKLLLTLWKNGIQPEHTLRSCYPQMVRTSYRTRCARHQRTD